MQKQDRLLRLPHIIGQEEVTPEQAAVNRQTGKSPKSPRPYIKPIINISRATWYEGIKDGRFPKPIKLGERTSVWRESSINELIDRFGSTL